MVLLPLLLIPAVAGLVAAGIVLRWPSVDPTSPRVVRKTVRAVEHELVAHRGLRRFVGQPHEPRRRDRSAAHGGARGGDHRRLPSRRTRAARTQPVRGHHDRSRLLTMGERQHDPVRARRVAGRHAARRDRVRDRRGSRRARLRVSAHPEPLDRAVPRRRPHRSEPVDQRHQGDLRSCPPHAEPDRAPPGPFVPERSHGHRRRVLGCGGPARRPQSRPCARMRSSSAARWRSGSPSACSRVLLDVHWFTDVIGGLALGWAWFALCSIAFGGRLLRFGAPVAIAERELELAGASVPTGSTQGARAPVGVEEQSVEEVEERTRRRVRSGRVGAAGDAHAGECPARRRRTRHRGRGRIRAGCRTIGPDR